MLHVNTRCTFGLMDLTNNQPPLDRVDEKHFLLGNLAVILEDDSASNVPKQKGL